MYTSCIFVCMCVNVYIMHMCVHVSMSVHVCVCVCEYVHACAKKQALKALDAAVFQGTAVL